MKFRFFLFVPVFIFATAKMLSGQNMVLKEIELANTDTARVRLMCDASFFYLNSKIDSALYFAQEALRISQNDNNTEGVSRSLNALGNVFLQTGQHDKALETFLSALKKAEQIQSQRRIAQTYSNIGNLYINQGEYRLPLEYLFKAKAINEEAKNFDYLTINFVNIGICYQYLNVYDSALIYLSKGLDIAISEKQHDYESAILYYIGTVHNDMKNFKLAKFYFARSIEMSRLYQNNNMLSSALLSMGRILTNEGSDSALHYLTSAYVIAAENQYHLRSMNAAKTLYEYYLYQNVSDSSLKYLKIRFDLQDSFFNQEKIKHIQTMTFQEKLRQDEIRAGNEKLKKERMKNLQYTGIAIFIFVLFILLIVLSKRKIKPKYIEYFGLIVLLLFFEFLALLLHPGIENWSGHRPVIALLFLVCIAAILVPVHHRLERWIKEKLARK